MSSSAGWYPDPGGQAGLFRYWTGSAWTAAVTSNPQATPPPPGAGEPQGFGQNSGLTGGAQGTGTQYPGGQYPGSQYPGSQYPGGQYQGYSTTTRKRSTTGWWLAGIAALVALGLVIYFMMTAASPGGGGGIFPNNDPSGVATPDVCPAAAATAAPTPATNDPNRVSGGKLSFPRMGDPWQAPAYENRVPFGSLAREQVATDQADYDGEGNDWVSNLLVSDLYVGDGFASTKTGAETVLKCVLGRYYSDAVVNEKRLSSTSHPVDGHDGWLIDSQLSFDIPGLNAKGERLLLLVVQTGTDEYGLFFASIPDTSPDRLPDARGALADLRVDG